MKNAFVINLPDDFAPTGANAEWVRQKVADHFGISVTVDHIQSKSRRGVVQAVLPGEPPVRTYLCQACGGGGRTTTEPPPSKE